MNYKEKIDRLDGIFAYDCDCVSSGIKDDDFKHSIKDGPHDEAVKMITDLAREYLNSSSGYTIEDIKCLIDWAESELGLEL